MAERFFFRDDVEAEKDRQFEAQKLAAQSPVPGPVGVDPNPPAQPTIPQVEDATAGAASAANAAFADAPAEPADPFADFRKTLEDQSPIRAQLLAQAQKKLDAPGAGFDAAAGAAQDKLGREIAASEEQARQGAITAFGGSGAQAQRAMGDVEQQGIIRQAELGRDIAAGRAEAENADIATGMAGLESVLSQMDSQSRILADFALTKSNQDFQAKMQDTAFMQTKDLQVMQNDLAKELQAKGFDQQTAERIASEQFNLLLQDRDQAYQENMLNLQNTFQRGERIESQDWQKGMQSSQMAFEENMEKLASTLRLEELGKAQEFQVSFQNMQNEFTRLRDQEGYSHEQALQLASQAFQKELQAIGYDQQTALEATRLAATAQENALNRASNEMMATAQLAQQDSQFAQELGLKQEELANNTKMLEKQIELMGLQGEQVQQAMKDSRIQTAVQLASIGMELSDGSQEAMAPFAALLGSAIDSFAQETGLEFDITSFLNQGGGDPTPPTPGSVASVDDAIKYLDDIFDTLPASVNRATLENNIRDYATGKDISSANVYNRLGSLPGAKDAGISTNKLTNRSGTTTTYNKPTQEGYDYYGYHRLKQLGLSEEQAWETMVRAVGADRMNKAYQTLNKQARS